MGKDKSIWMRDAYGSNFVNLTGEVIEFHELINGKMTRTMTLFPENKSIVGKYVIVPRDFVKHFTKEGFVGLHLLSVDPNSVITAKNKGIATTQFTVHF